MSEKYNPLSFYRRTQLRLVLDETKCSVAIAMSQLMQNDWKADKAIVGVKNLQAILAHAKNQAIVMLQKAGVTIFGGNIPIKAQ